MKHSVCLDCPTRVVHTNARPRLFTRPNPDEDKSSLLQEKTKRRDTQLVHAPTSPSVSVLSNSVTSNVHADQFLSLHGRGNLYAGRVLPRFLAIN